MIINYIYIICILYLYQCLLLILISYMCILINIEYISRNYQISNSINIYKEIAKAESREQLNQFC